MLDAIRDTSKVAWILLGKASVAAVEGNVITMAFDSEGNAKGFASSGSDGYLANVLERMFGARPVIMAMISFLSVFCVSRMPICLPRRRTQIRSASLNTW